jgi:phage I-like protein
MKKVTELENKMFDMMLQNEISILSNKYKDFEVREVLEMAKEKQTTNLEDAYLLVKARKQTPTDVESLKNQLRQEIIKELANDKEATSTIISSNDNQPVVQDNKPQLSEGEKRVARMMKMSEADYLKWRDIDSRNKIKK